MGRTYRQFSIEERFAIARLSGEGVWIRKIAAALDRAASSVARELKRNTGATQYRPSLAQQRSRSRRWSGSRLDRNELLRTHVLTQLSLGWSPEQIVGRSRRQGKAPIGVEAIYRFIYAQIRRSNDYSWRRYLPRGKSRRGWGRGAHHPMQHIKDRVSITERPKAVDNRRQAGHWEADLLHPRKSGATVLVAQERTSRFTFIAKQAGKHAKPVAHQLQRWLEPLPKELRRSLTQDNGPEFFEHHQLNPLGIKTYFCNPHSPWQKGGIENINGRIRRYIPAGTDPLSFTHQDLQSLAHRLNTTPRKGLNFRTPAEVFLKYLLHFKRESTFRPAPE